MADHWDPLYDPRITPPEPWDHDLPPGAESAYYEGMEGHPCPCCKTPKAVPYEPGPRGCWVCGDDEPAYKRTSADYRGESWKAAGEHEPL